MPNRILRDWTDSAKFENMEASPERLFVRLLMKADDYGRYHAWPKLLISNCFPLVHGITEPLIDAWLGDLEKARLIVRYSNCDKKLLAIVNFGQRLKQSRAKFPPPDGKDAAWVPVSGNFREVTARDGDGIGVGDGIGDVEEPDTAAGGNRPADRWKFDGRSIIGFTDDDMARLAEAHPAVAIVPELRKAELWLESNPTKRKKNVYRFFVNWIGRTQERGGSVASRQPARKRVVGAIDIS